LVLFESYREKRRRGNDRKRENIDIKKPINEDKKKTIPYQLGLNGEIKKNKIFIKEFKKKL